MKLILIIKIFLFSILNYLFLLYFSAWIKLGFYVTTLASGEAYNVYLLSFLWYFWLFPFLILTPWLNHYWQNTISPFYDIFDFSFLNILKIILNLTFYFIFYCLFFKKEIKSFISWKNLFKLKGNQDKIVKYFYIILFFVVYMNAFLVILKILYSI